MTYDLGSVQMPGGATRTQLPMGQQMDNRPGMPTDQSLQSLQDSGVHICFDPHMLGVAAV